MYMYIYIFIYIYIYIYISHRMEYVNMLKKITRFAKPEPKDICITREIQTAINVKACKRYARGDSTHQTS